MTGCANGEKAEEQKMIKVGIMLSDVGLGDQSFSDAAFNGLIKARDELGIIFDYRELKDTGSYEKGLVELVEEKNDLIVGLGFMVQEDLEKVAKKYPDQHFLLIDSVSDLPNITSITFKEDQGSFLAGVVAALTTKTNKVGFIGGADVPLIRKFSNGFIQGVHSVNPDIQVIEVFAGDFGNDQLGARLAQELIGKQSDVLYAAAGFTGVGVLKEAEANGIYAIGVDSDQYFYAEKAVITSMQKNVNVAIYQTIEQLVSNGGIQEGKIELGLKEGGVGLAPIRIISLPDEHTKILEDWAKKLTNGEVKVQ
ncbi:BMP family ABC transporter substrate-binding protein [Bacillus timonensis]|nr:BMP family ABC transporter substrate-binding protein [Bacillus timonensis]